MDQCAGQYAIDNTQATFPSQWKGSSSTKIFSFDLQIKLLSDFCIPLTSFDFLSIQINPASGPVTLLNFDWSQSMTSGPSGSSSVVSYTVHYHGSSTPLVNYNGQYDISVNTEFELLTTIDLTFAAPRMKGYLAYREKVLTGDRGITVGSDWKFDSSTKIFLCSSSANAPNYYCSIKAFNYWFTNPSDYLYYAGQLTPTLLGSYLFGEGSGYRISDSESLGSAYLGNSGSSTSDTTNSPTWLSTEVGVEFTSATQFVNIKPFQISKVSEYDLGSFTISFWIRYTQSASNGGNIFQYTNYDMSHTYFSLQIDDNGVLTANINTEADSFMSTPISSTGWTLVAVTFALHPVNTLNYLMFSIGGSSSYGNFISSQPPIFAYNSLNKVHIGGPGSFKGSIYDFRIYSPGSSAVITKGSCSTLSTNCLVSLGKLTNNQCLTKPAVTCHSSCKTCFDSTEQGCLSCYTDYHISYTQCISDYPVITTPTLSPATTEAIKGSQKAAQAATQAVNAVTAGSPSGISAAIGGKIFSNIKYLNISYSNSLEEALTSWGSSFISLGLTPDLPSSITKQIPKEDLPYVFNKRDIPSSFIENFWESLGMVLFVTFIFSGVFILEWTAQKFSYKYLPHHLLFAIRAIVQNFLLAQLYSVFGDMLFFAALEFRAPNSHHKWSRLSLASGIILIIIMFVILSYHIRLLRKYQNLRKNSDDQALTKFENENKGSGVLFQDFKDVSTIRQSFLLLLTGRDLLFSLLLTVMFDHPLIECVFILVLNIAMVIYLILLPPFKSVFDATQQLFYEVVTLAVNVSVLVLAILDEINSPDGNGLRSKIGKFVIIINMIFNFGSLAFMLVKAFQTLYEVYKTYKARKNKQKGDLKIQAPDRFVKNLDLPQQETNPKPYVEKIDLVQFELDQSTLKPLDVSNESFIINKESSEVYQSTPKFETITYSFDQNNQFTLKLDQTQEENLDKRIPSTLEVSSLGDENDDRTEALKAILEKNKTIRKAIKFQTKLNEAALKVKNARQTSPKKK